MIYKRNNNNNNVKKRLVIFKEREKKILSKYLKRTGFIRRNYHCCIFKTHRIHQTKLSQLH